jgi:hypothetical protein
VADESILEILLRSLERVDRGRLRLGTAEIACFSQRIPPGSIPSRKNLSHAVFKEGARFFLFSINSAVE